VEEYTDFAFLYDEFMEDTPYDEWCVFICDILKSRGITDGLVCDLGSGTGEMTVRLKENGYDMIGIDNSESMLAIARAKDDSTDILYLLQDMREMELYGTVRAIVSVCDSLNYITDFDDLVHVFKLCNNYLDPEGILIFDFNTRFKYEEVIGDDTIAETREDASFIWENSFDPETSLNEYDITFFTKEESGLYRRFTETHIQRGYTLSEIKEAIKKAGMIFEEAYDDYTGSPADDESERITVIARECGKKE
jgi:ubiquinone/menaquinone biosynthesis C-methylase UbiE